jgi:Tfp pilus assembly protein PilV
MMITNCSANKRRNNSGSGFTLPEACVSVAVMSVFLTTFFTCLLMGNTLLRSSREQERATQVLVEKFEEIRLYTWAQINSNGFIPTNFTAPFDPYNTNSALVYSGTLTISNAPVTTSYSNNLMQVTAQLVWTDGNVSVTQSMTSLVAEYGMQNYIY